MLKLLYLHLHLNRNAASASALGPADKKARVPVTEELLAGLVFRVRELLLLLQRRLSANHLLMHATHVT